MILGDSLLVMASLAEKGGLKGRVQSVYFDPPYGIKFGSNWQVSTRKRDVRDGKGEDATRQPEQVRAFRDTWRLGIHSYLNYLRDRLVAAHNLLAETGSVFVQIGDQNVHLVRNLLDEVFGSENFISFIAFKKTTGATADFLAGATDYLLWFGKDISQTKYRPLYKEKALGGEGAGNYGWLQLDDGVRRRLTKEEITQQSALPKKARVFAFDNLTSQSIGRDKGEGAASWFKVPFEGRIFEPSMQVRWKTNEAGMERLRHARRLGATGNTLWYVRFLEDFPAFSLNNIWDDTGSSFMSDKVYVVQTAARIVERCILMTTDPGDLILDPTCGSGTTAYVGEQWGRRWITIDTSRVALALARTRLMTARYPYYLLADSPDGLTKEAELSGRVPPQRKTDGDIRKGFVYKRVSHITLRSIANNPDIKEGMTSDEIDAAIARHGEIELLFDKPYEDGKRIRVTGPLTVESLSPHRVLSSDEKRPASEADGHRFSPPAQFETMILENLRKSGVQNTKKAERLVFETLEVHPGTWINGAGSYADAGGKTRRVAVSIGPEHGTVGSTQIK
jgi:adenine-specific DNA-methyltransferase